MKVNGRKSSPPKENLPHHRYKIPSRLSNVIMVKKLKREMTGVRQFIWPQRWMAKISIYLFQHRKVDRWSIQIQGDEFHRHIFKIQLDKYVLDFKCESAKVRSWPIRKAESNENPRREV